MRRVRLRRGTSPEGSARFFVARACSTGLDRLGLVSFPLSRPLIPPVLGSQSQVVGLGWLRAAVRYWSLARGLSTQRAPDQRRSGAPARPGSASEQDRSRFGHTVIVINHVLFVRASDMKFTRGILTRCRMLAKRGPEHVRHTFGCRFVRLFCNAALIWLARCRPGRARSNQGNSQSLPCSPPNGLPDPDKVAGSDSAKFCIPGPPRRHSRSDRRLEPHCSPFQRQ